MPRVFISYSHDSNEHKNEVHQLADKLKSDGLLEKIGGVPYLSRVIDMVPTSANVEHYANIVKEKGVLRKLIKNSTQIVNAFDYGDDIRIIICGPFIPGIILQPVYEQVALIGRYFRASENIKTVWNLNFLHWQGSHHRIMFRKTNTVQIPFKGLFNHFLRLEIIVVRVFTMAMEINFHRRALTHVHRNVKFHSAKKQLKNS